MSVKLVKKRRRTDCGCSAGLARFDVIDIGAIDTELGHSFVYGGGCGHSMEQHLRTVNPIKEFDDFIRFVDETHTYYYKINPPHFNSERKINSSTMSVLAQYFNKFNATVVLQRMRAKGRMDDPNDKYYGMSDKEIRQAWIDNGLEASSRGTEMHACIERFLNNARIANDIQETFDHFTLFRIWHLQFMVGERMVPFRTELCMFDEEHEMAGMCDLVAQRLEWRDDPEKKNWLILIDWKCTVKCNAGDPEYVKLHPEMQKDIQRAQRWRKPAKPPLCELEDCDLSKYYTQLNVYRWMMERNTPYRVKEMRIVAFHNDNDRYVDVKVPNLQNLVEKIMALRKERMLKKYREQFNLVRAQICSIEAPTTGPNAVDYGFLND